MIRLSEQNAKHVWTFSNVSILLCPAEENARAARKSSAIGDERTATDDGCTDIDDERTDAADGGTFRREPVKFTYGRGQICKTETANLHV
jgi:hypothetical protein